MARAKTTNADPLGHDSFLDVVANMVGILIILVMVVGMRAKNAPIQAAIEAATAQTREELARQAAVEQSIRGDVWKIATEIERVRAEAVRRCAYRDTLATAVSLLEHELKQLEAQMDAGAKEDFELVRRIAETRRRLQELRREQVRLEQAEPEPVVLENRPTPLSRVVDDHEAHFQLRGGYIAYIPLEDLVADFKADARRKLGRLNEVSEITETVGPRGGFRLRYTLERKQVPPEVAAATGISGSYAQLKRWTLIPVREPLGEPIRTVSTNFAGSATHSTRWATRWPAGRCPSACRSAARPKAASRRRNSPRACRAVWAVRPATLFSGVERPGTHRPSQCCYGRETDINGVAGSAFAGVSHRRVASTIPRSIA